MTSSRVRHVLLASREVVPANTVAFVNVRTREGVQLRQAGVHLRRQGNPACQLDEAVWLYGDGLVLPAPGRALRLRRRDREADVETNRCQHASTVGARRA